MNGGADTLKKFTAMVLAIFIVCIGILPVVGHAATEESAQCAYTVKVYYDFHCDEEQTFTAYFDEGDFIEDEDVIDYFLRCYCDFCKKKVDAHDENRVFCPECHKNGCNQYNFLKTLGTEIKATPEGGAIHVYFVSGTLQVHAYRFYGNRTDNENAINNAKATYKHIASEGILYVVILLALTVVGVMQCWGYVADYKAERKARAEMNADIRNRQHENFNKDAEQLSAEPSEKSE